MRQIKKIHFIGIGGAGMGGIAEVLHNKGYTITGSDLSHNSMTAHLESLGINIVFNHNAANVNESDAVVITSAIDESNPELLAAKQKEIPVVRRAEMLAELMRFGHSIAVAGTHGKTTTTSILASIIATAGLDPTFVIGGKLNSIGTNAKLGQGDYFIAEADESDASFLHLSPVISIVTNIDRDHMTTYGGDFSNLQKVFVDFLQRLPFYGLAVLNIDNLIVREIILSIKCQLATIGFSEDATYRVYNYKQIKGVSYFSVFDKKRNTEYNFELNLPGKHNVLNALAAIAVCIEEGIDIKYIQKSLKEFKGISRRFQVYEDVKLGDDCRFTLVDDYGHHPEELKATITALKEGWPNHRVVMLFQPHRYTRTRDLFDDFVEVLSDLEALALVPVYAASESLIPGASGQDLYNAVVNNEKIISQNHKCYYFDSLTQMLDDFRNIINNDDIVVVQGAGDIGELTSKLLNYNKTKTE